MYMQARVRSSALPEAAQPHPRSPRCSPPDVVSSSYPGTLYPTRSNPAANAGACSYTVGNVSTRSMNATWDSLISSSSTLRELFDRLAAPDWGYGVGLWVWEAKDFAVEVKWDRTGVETGVELRWEARAWRERVGRPGEAGTFGAVWSHVFGNVEVHEISAQRTAWRLVSNDEHLPWEPRAGTASR